VDYFRLPRSDAKWAAHTLAFGYAQMALDEGNYPRATALG